MKDLFITIYIRWIVFCFPIIGTFIFFLLKKLFAWKNKENFFSISKIAIGRKEFLIKTFLCVIPVIAFGIFFILSKDKYFFFTNTTLFLLFILGLFIIFGMTLFIDCRKIDISPEKKIWKFFMNFYQFIFVFHTFVCLLPVFMKMGIINFGYFGLIVWHVSFKGMFFYLPVLFLAFLFAIPVSHKKIENI